MMMRPLSIRVTLAACACVLLAAAPALGQEITPEEVTAVLEAPAVKGALDACGKSHPHLAASIEFVFIVGTGGQVTLNETKPAVSPELFLCFQTAAKSIQFKKMQSAFEITYPLEVAAYAPVTPTPLPPS